MPRLRQAVSAQYAVLYSLLDRAEAPRGRTAGMIRKKGWKSEIQKLSAEVKAQRKEADDRRREFLAARDAEYAAHPHGAVTVSVRADGRRVITRGIVCGTGVGGCSKQAEPVPSTGYLHPAPPKAAGKDGSAGKRDGDEL